MTRSVYLARLCANDARYDSTPPCNVAQVAAAGDSIRYRMQRAAMQSRYFDRMARNALQAIQAQHRYLNRKQSESRLNSLFGDLHSARRQGLWWHDAEIQASRSR